MSVYSEEVTIEPLRLHTPRKHDFTDDELRRLYRKKLSDSQMARALGVSRWCIRKRREQLRLPANFDHGRKR